MTILRNIMYAVGTKGHFSEGDFNITKFGIGTDGNPFLTVEGKAGGSTPQKEDTGLAYVFVTNNGTYAGTSDWMYTKWHAHELTLDEKNCVKSMNMNSGVGVENRRQRKNHQLKCNIAQECHDCRVWA